MNKSKITLLCFWFIFFYSLSPIKASAEIYFSIKESKVCNIYYKLPRELKRADKLILKNSDGKVIRVVNITSDLDEIFFGNVPFGGYYIEAHGSELRGNCFPIVLEKDSLYTAHIKKDLDVKYNLFTEEQSKVIVDLGYTGTDVTVEVLKEVGRILGFSYALYPNADVVGGGSDNSKVPTSPVDKPSNNIIGNTNGSYENNNGLTNDYADDRFIEPYLILITLISVLSLSIFCLLIKNKNKDKDNSDKEVH